uniref:G-protein coupled receptor Mth-like 11 protein n=1 Tax=Dastarcus helophoroides TaxID=1169899 RepID=A0A2Z5H022_9CUCU|nr:G-protein coupled receptor Mth-like 11 protein [Dastarcus helophoroides]
MIKWAICLLWLNSLEASTSRQRRPKCCDFDSYVRKNGTDFVCDNSEVKFMQIAISSTNYLTNQNKYDEEDFCVDYYEDKFYLFEVSENNIVNEEAINEKIFPKCCPLNYRYNSNIHGCSPAGDDDEHFMNATYFKIGLRKCKIILDYPIRSAKDFFLSEEYTRLKLKSGEEFSSNDFCLDKALDGQIVARGCTEDITVCDKIPCVHKCCADGFSFINGSNCLPTFVHGLNLSFTNRIHMTAESFGIVHGIDYKIYYLNPKKNQFYMDPNATFHFYLNRTGNFEEFRATDRAYCVEHAFKPRALNGYGFFFILEKPFFLNFAVTRWVKFVSCLFLILTMLVYILLGETRKLFGKTLISYCMATLLCFAFLTYLQFFKYKYTAVCKILAFLSLFGATASFCWLNVMCYDIWVTFGAPKGFIGVHQRKRDRKKFLLYNLHGWGTPIFLVSLVFAFHYSEVLPKSFHPYIGLYSCYLDRLAGNYAHLIFSVLPTAVIEIVNFVLFIKTITYCIRVKSEINRMNDTCKAEGKIKLAADKENFILLVKLSIVMGILFLFEVVSAVVDLKKNKTLEYLEVVWDTFNSLQGVFIFIIFICKRKIYREICTKLGFSKTRKMSLSSTATSQMVIPLTSTKYMEDKTEM